MTEKILFDNTRPYGSFEIWHGDQLYASFMLWEEWWKSPLDDNLCEYQAKLVRRGKEFFLETKSYGGKEWIEKIKTPFRIQI